MRAAIIIIHAVIVLLIATASGPLRADPIPAGSAQLTVELKHIVMSVYTYRPSNCATPSVLLVFHGISRNADGYRDHAKPLADKLCMIVVAPLFDKDRFPGWRYQEGGIVHHHSIQDPDKWTGQLVVALIEWVRRQERASIPIFMIGHSAGAQFLSRLAAFIPTDARRMVITNPSTYVVPSLQVAAPFGLGGVYNAGDEEPLRRYLAAPVTIFLGEQDVEDEERNDSPEAMAQGTTRLDRGLKTFNMARTLAQSRSWTFNWRLVQVPRVGHNATKMFSSHEAIDALAP
jgi:poly(3-hydroxybutyrate) depolymerase